MKSRRILSHELSNNDIVIYVIFKLGGIEKKVHTEDIAMESFKLAPENFSWTLPKYFKKYPDKEIVHLTLKNLKAKKNEKIPDFLLLVRVKISYIF